MKSLGNKVISDPDEAHDFSRLEFSPDGSSLAAWHGLGAVIVWGPCEFAAGLRVQRRPWAILLSYRPTAGLIFTWKMVQQPKLLELASGRVCILATGGGWRSAADPKPDCRPKVRNAEQRRFRIMWAPDGKTFAAANADD